MKKWDSEACRAADQAARCGREHNGGGALATTKPRGADEIQQTQGRLAGRIRKSSKDEQKTLTGSKGKKGLLKMKQGLGRKL